MVKFSEVRGFSTVQACLGIVGLAWDVDRNGRIRIVQLDCKPLVHQCFLLDDYT